MVKLKIITCNVRGMIDSVKRKKIFMYSKINQADVVFFQKTHSGKSCVNNCKSQWGGEMVFSHGTNKSCGVAIAFKRGLNIGIEKIDRDTEKVILLGTTDHTILGGDLNVYLDVEMDRKGGNPVMTKSAIFVNEFLNQNDWVDIWRTLNPGRFQYTWKRKAPFIGTRLDYFLLPLSTSYAVQNCAIIPGCASDHLFVVLEVHTTKIGFGRGFWKLNTSLLQDAEYVKGVNEIREFYLGENAPNRDDND